MKQNLRQAALLLLNRALAPTGTVRGSGDGGIAIELRGGLTIPIELAPWEEGREGDRRDGVVWILPRGPRALRERLREQGEALVRPARRPRVGREPEAGEGPALPAGPDGGGRRGRAADRARPRGISTAAALAEARGRLADLLELIDAALQRRLEPPP